MVLIIKFLGLSNPFKNSLLQYQRNVCLEHQTRFLKKSLKRITNLKSRNVGSNYILLIFPITSIALGIWQVYRLRWKTNLIQYLKERVSLEPVPLPENLNDISKFEYHPVRVTGTFLHDKEVYLGPRTEVVDGKFVQGEGMAPSNRVGLHVITPLKLSDRKETILVNRGWVKVEMGKPQKRVSGQIKGEVTISGLVRLEEKRPLFMQPSFKRNRYTFRELKRMASVLETSEIYIDAIESIPGGPNGGQTVVNPRNEHLSYIVTWFSLGVGTSYMWYTKYFRKLII